jgi:hypothetical protein
MFSGCYVFFERRHGRKQQHQSVLHRERTCPVGPECPLLRLCKKLFGELVFAVYVGEALVAALIGKCEAHVVDP